MEPVFALLRYTILVFPVSEEMEKLDCGVVQSKNITSKSQILNEDTE